MSPVIVTRHDGRPAPRKLGEVLDYRAPLTVSAQERGDIYVRFIDSNGHETGWHASRLLIYPEDDR